MKISILVLMVAALVGIGLPVAAQTILVTTTDPAVAIDGQCSLIEAIVNANDDAATHADCAAGSGTDIIELATSATYVLDQVQARLYGPNGLPIIRSSMTIEGRDSTISRSPTASAFRIFVINSSGNLALHDLTLQGGDSGPMFCGGALLNAFGRATLVRTTVTESTAPAGGGICNSSGPMTLTDSVVSFNTASNGLGGGVLSMTEVALATLDVDRTSVLSNLGVFGGGIATNGSEVTIVDSNINGNQAFSSTGYAFCGGLGLEGGIAEIHRSLISDNTAESLADLSGFGGGVCVVDNTTIISNCTISGNEARGAATAGSSTGRGGGIMVIGGAWYEPATIDTMVIVEDSTICDNTAENYGGGISVYRFAGTKPVELKLRNTIVAENFEAGGVVLGNCVQDGSDVMITSADFNLTDDSTCNLMAANDLVVADAMLAPLALCGGPTCVHRPKAGSPAVDSGDDVTCPTYDQRHNLRRWDGDNDGLRRCDRGAVELGAPHIFDEGRDKYNPAIPGVNQGSRRPD